MGVVRHRAASRRHCGNDQLNCLLPSKGRKAAPHPNNYGRKLGDGVGKNFVGTGLLLLKRLLK
jgi:hypothetical protein